MSEIKRCSWCLKDNLYMDYHDNVWGKPEYKDIKLFEYLNLEGAQAGLSWHTILKKMETYHQAFDGWDPEKMVRFSDKKLIALESNPGIIRNKLKIKAAIGNARSFLEMRASGLDFSHYIWSFVDGTPIVNNFRSMNEIPAWTSISQKMSKDLKSRGFKFVGPTITYAFMQAVGLVNDHILDCAYRKIDD